MSIGEIELRTPFAATVGPDTPVFGGQRSVRRTRQRFGIAVPCPRSRLRGVFVLVRARFPTGWRVGEIAATGWGGRGPPTLTARRSGRCGARCGVRSRASGRLGPHPEQASQAHPSRRASMKPGPLQHPVHPTRPRRRDHPADRPSQGELTATARWNHDPVRSGRAGSGVPGAEQSALAAARGRRSVDVPIPPPAPAVSPEASSRRAVVVEGPGAPVVPVIRAGLPRGWGGGGRARR